MAAAWKGCSYAATRAENQTNVGITKDSAEKSAVAVVPVYSVMDMWIASQAPASSAMAFCTAAQLPSTNATDMRE